MGKGRLAGVRDSTMVSLSGATSCCSAVCTPVPSFIGDAQDTRGEDLGGALGTQQGTGPAQSYPRAGGRALRAGIASLRGTEWQGAGETALGSSF